MLDFEAIAPYIYQIIEASKYTIIIAFFSALFGFLLGLVLALFKQSKVRILKSFALIYTDIFRGTPVILQLAIIWYIVFGSIPFRISPLVAAIITFTINSAAYVSEVLRAGIENVDKGQIEAAKAMGVRKKDINYDIIFPQAVRKTLPPLINEFATLIKESSIVYFIGVKDIMYYVNQATSNSLRLFEPLIIAGICYYVLVKIVTLIGKWVEVSLSYDKHK